MQKNKLDHKIKPTPSNKTGLNDFMSIQIKDLQWLLDEKMVEDLYIQEVIIKEELTFILKVVVKDTAIQAVALKLDRSPHEKNRELVLGTQRDSVRKFPQLNTVVSKLKELSPSLESVRIKYLDFNNP